MASQVSTMLEVAHGLSHEVVALSTMAGMAGTGMDELGLDQRIAQSLERSQNHVTRLVNLLAEKHEVHTGGETDNA